MSELLKNFLMAIFNKVVINKLQKEIDKCRLELD